MSKLNHQDFSRIANNFLTESGIPYAYQEIDILRRFNEYYESHLKDIDKKYKVALCFICINQPYWEFIPLAVRGAKEYFLPGHNVDYFLWSDIPEDDPMAKETIHFPMGSIEWPAPTLFRFHTMLQQEEKLKEYDYVFYCDIDMKFVSVVGDEILPVSGLTAALHPMYALRKEYWPPYEPNEKSTAFIKRPGMVINDNGQPRFMPQYYAGGLQGGKTEPFIQAMKEMRMMIEKDQMNNYVAIWNDESYWNKYLAENTPEKVLPPSYIYPDSLINEYYVKLWGVNYQPRLMTLTKKFSTSPEGGQALSEMMKTL